MIDVALRMKLTRVAEGVETYEQVVRQAGA